MSPINKLLKRLDRRLLIVAIFLLGIVVGLVVGAGLTRETLTVIAAILAAAIGFYAYSWQKAVDTEREIMREVRELVRAFTETSLEIEMSQPFIDDPDAEEKMRRFQQISDEEKRFYVIRDQLYAISPQSVVAALYHHDKAVRTWKIEFTRVDGGEEQNSVVRKCYDEMRKTHMDFLDVAREAFELQKSATSLSDPVRIHNKGKSS